MFPGTYVPRYLCNYVPRYLCYLNLCSGNQWRIQGGFLVARNPPPPGHDFFLIRGFTSLHAPTFTSHLNLRLLETPLSHQTSRLLGLVPSVICEGVPATADIAATYNLKTICHRHVCWQKSCIVGNIVTKARSHKSALIHARRQSKCVKRTRFQICMCFCNLHAPFRSLLVNAREVQVL